MLEEFLAGACAVHIHSNETANQLLALLDPVDFCGIKYDGSDDIEFPYVYWRPECGVPDAVRHRGRLPAMIRDGHVYEDNDFFAAVDAEQQTESQISLSSLDTLL